MSGTGPRHGGARSSRSSRMATSRSSLFSSLLFSSRLFFSRLFLLFSSLLEDGDVPLLGRHQSREVDLAALDDAADPRLVVCGVPAYAQRRRRLDVCPVREPPPRVRLLLRRLVEGEAAPARGGDCCSHQLGLHQQGEEALGPSFGRLSAASRPPLGRLSATSHGKSSSWSCFGSHGT